MDLTPQLQASLSEAETNLRSLASAYTLEGQYERAHAAVEAARAIAKVLAGGMTAFDSLPIEPEDAPADAPRFLRDGAYLVEVRNTQGSNGYQHRARFEDLLPIIAAMVEDAGQHKRFSVPGVRQRLAAAPKTPRYQVYLALNFLVWSGLTRKQGKGEYSILVPASQLSSTAEAAWTQLPEAL